MLSLNQLNLTLSLHSGPMKWPEIHLQSVPRPCLPYWVFTKIEGTQVTSGNCGKSSNLLSMLMSALSELMKVAETL